VSRILILTASYGAGYHAAARSLTAALNKIGGPATARRIDPLARFILQRYGPAS
jgi:hypothetical protein